MTLAIAVRPRRGIRRDAPSRLSRREFELFVRNYSGRLLGVAKRFLRADEDAADAVQDALLAAFASRHRFQGESTVYTWLYRIVVNVCLMKLRARPAVDTVSLDRLAPALDERRGADRPAWIRLDEVESRLAGEELRDKVREAIDRLPHDYRTILVLRDIEQLDTDQTAALLQLSRAAVKTRLHRARRSLKILLEPLLL